MLLTNALTVTLAACACVTDLHSHRIPNALTVGGAGAAVAYHALTGGVPALGLSVAGWTLGVLLFVAPFALRGLGGGDVKLIGALGAWVGPGDMLSLALYTALAGAVTALVVAAFHQYLGSALRNIWRLLCHWRVAGPRALPEVSLDTSDAPRLAYALPIFCGTVATLWLK